MKSSAKSLTSVGTVLAVVKVAFLAVVFEARVRVARRAARVLPQAGFVEPEPLRQLLAAAELPLAGDARGVARVFQQWPNVVALRSIAPNRV